MGLIDVWWAITEATVQLEVTSGWNLDGIPMNIEEHTRELPAVKFS